MLTYSDKPVEVVKTAEEDRFKERRLNDVELLLQSLVEREETTLKLIIDCLYDVGSINLINQRIRQRPLNRFMRAIARYSKPIVRIIALRWLKKNLPKLLTAWLAGKVAFPPSNLKKSTKRPATAKPASAKNETASSNASSVVYQESAKENSSSQLEVKTHPSAKDKTASPPISRVVYKGSLKKKPKSQK